MGAPNDEWTLGAEPADAARPLERPAYSGERARAAALDLALLTVLWAIVVYFASRAAHVELMGLRPAWPYLAGYLAFLGLTYAGYFTGTTGQTLGKIAMGLRVVDAGGRPPGYLRAFVRAALGSLPCAQRWTDGRLCCKSVSIDAAPISGDTGAFESAV